eukprot:UN06459
MSLGNKWYNSTSAPSYQNTTSQQNPIPTDKACIIEITGNWYSNLNCRRSYPSQPYHHYYTDLSHKIIHIHDDNDTQAKTTAFQHLLLHFKQSVEHSDYNKWMNIITPLVKRYNPTLLQAKTTFQIGIMTTTNVASSTFTPLLLS